MKAILVRVGIDHSAGEWNAPVDTKTGEFVYVPIPETPEWVLPGQGRPYLEVVPALKRMSVSLPDHLLKESMHLDPDFKTLTYGDMPRRGAPLKTMQRGDVLAFYAGLRSLSDDSGLVYALIGVFFVDEVLMAENVPAARRDENAHTRRPDPTGEIIVRAQKGLSGRLTRCLPIGERRDNAYRVRRDLLAEWGGMSVKDGFIQRSGTLPSFLHPDKFCHWLGEQHVALIAANNQEP